MCINTHKRKPPMATVIDAFVVTLGLDPKGVQKGGKEAGEAFDKTKAKAEKVGKDIEAKVSAG